MLTDVLGKKKNILRLTEEKWKKNKMKGRGKVERVGQKRREKRSVKEGEKKERKKIVIGKKWALPGTEPILGLKDREGKKKKR